MNKSPRNMISKQITLALCLVLFSQVTLAQSAKKQTVGELLKRVKEDSRGGQLKSMQKNDVAVPESQFNFKPQNTVNLQQIKPPRSTEVLKFEPGNDQAQYEKTLDRQIAELYKLTQKMSTNDNRGELWLRLAELYVEKSALVDARKQDQYDAQLKAFQDGQTKAKPKLDTTESRQYNVKAIQLYEWFLRDFPKDDKVSQALFFLGYNYFELGQAEKGAKYYDELTSRFPKSQFVGEAHFALGEYYFEKEQWPQAYKEYAFLIKSKRHRLYTFSLYKGGWCLFRMGKTEAAISYLDSIVKAGAADSTASTPTKKSLNRSKLENEALRDLVVFYSDVGDTNRAVNYFKSLNSSDQNNYIEKLAYYYGDKGNKDAARDVFHQLIKQNPTSKKSFDYQYQIVQNYFYSKNSPQFREELYKWINDYRKNSAWAEQNANDPAFIESCAKLREQTLRNYILQQHQTAQNSRAAFSRQSALEGYQLYFQEFGDSASVADMHFYFAELLYDMNKFEEAVTHYTWVAENAPQSKFGAKAAQNLLLTIEKVLPKDEELQKKVGQSTEPIPFDPRVEKFLRSAQWYTEKFPNSDKISEIKFRMGRLYYQTNHFNEAEAQFKEIVAKYPNTKFSEYSANLLLDIYNIKKDYVGLEKVGNELLQNSSISTSKAGQDIRGVLERSSFKKAQDLETEKKYLESATQFESFAQQNPKSELVAMATFNAGVNFERSGKNFEAIQNYKKTLQLKDKNSEAFKPKAEKLLAKLYQDAGQFEDSARLFKKIAAENPKDPLVPNYLFNAALMFEALGQNKEAIQAYNEFLKVAKPSQETNNTLFNLATILRKANSATAAFEKYKEYSEVAVNSDKKVEALYWVYTLGVQLNKLTAAQEAKQKLVSSYNALNGSTKTAAASFVAKIKYQEAVTSFKEMRNVEIPADPAKQAKAVDRKLKLVAQTSEMLTEVIKYDAAEEVVNSLNLLGETNETIGQAILSAPMPSSITKEEDKKKYLEGVQNIANPFLKKAEESYKTSVERGSDLEAYTDGYKHALAKMSKLDSKNYYNGSEIISDSKIIQWMGDK